MKIKYAMPKETEEITEFLSSIFEKNSLAIYCSDLERKLSEDKYKSIIALDDNRIIGHFGITILDRGVIFNMMAVNRSYRGYGLAGKLLQNAIDYSRDRGDIDHVLGYCVLQHQYSEKIHDDTFKPVGFVITQDNPLNNSDPLSKSRLFGGNLAVCKMLKKPENLVLNYAGFFKRDIKRILNSIGMSVEFGEGRVLKQDIDDYVEIDIKKSSDVLNSLKEDYVCLGLLPNPHSGFYNFGFVKKDKLNPQGELVVSNDERKIFIQSILKHIN